MTMEKMRGDAVPDVDTAVPVSVAPAADGHVVITATTTIAGSPPAPDRTGPGAATAEVHARASLDVPHPAAPPAHPGYEPIRRVLDCTLAGGALLVLSPLWIAFAAAIRLTSPGPSLFARTVVGQGGRPFTYYKFRTMHHRNDDAHHRAFLEKFVRHNAPYALETDPVTGEEKPVYKVVRDPRVTPLGRLLRRTSLDEIPQLYNVLRGEMCIVGPRPPIEFEYQLYDEATMMRLSVPPGLTGLAQVRGRGRISFGEMVAHDLDYIRRRSTWLDLRIMAATIRVLYKGA